MDKEWALPLVFALVGAGAAYALAPEPEAPSAGPPPMTAVFPTGPRGTCGIEFFVAPQTLHACRGQVLVVRGGGLPPGAHVPNVSWHGAVGLAPIVGRPMPDACEPAPCPDADAFEPSVLRPPEGRVLTDLNTTGVRATVYVFAADGLLVSSNAPGDGQARFQKDMEVFLDAGNHTFFLGEGQAPHGMVEAPEPLRSMAAGRLVGLPVGGVASAVVTDHPYTALFDELYVTARIDALVPTDG